MRDSRTTYDKGESFAVYSHAFGCFELERFADGETLFFQDDDADRLLRHLEDAELVAETLRTLGVKHTCDFVAEQYFNG